MDLLSEFQPWAIRCYMLRRTESESREYAEILMRLSDPWMKVDYDNWNESHERARSFERRMRQLDKIALRRWLNCQVDHFLNSLELSGPNCE